MKTNCGLRFAEILSLSALFCMPALAARAQTNHETSAQTKLVFEVGVTVRPASVTTNPPKPVPATNAPAAPSRAAQVLYYRDQERIRLIAELMRKPGPSARADLLGALLRPAPRNLYGLIDVFAPLPESGSGGGGVGWSWGGPSSQWPPVAPISSDPSKNLPPLLGEP